MYQSQCEVDLKKQQGKSEVRVVALCLQSRVFDGFHHDGLERRGTVVVVSTNPFFKLTLVLPLT